MTSDDVTSDNVVEIGPVRARVLFPALGKVEAYWEGLRDGRAMPARAEVDPRGIADVLEFAFVLERVAPGVARIRLAGMHLDDLMAMSVRGMPITAMFLPEARRELQQVIENVLETPAVVRLTLGSDRGFTRPPLDGQMMLLPLRDAHGNVTRILGALETRGKIGRGPRRFMIRDIETKALPNTDAGRPRGVFDRFRPATQTAPRPGLTPIRADSLPTDAGFAPRTAELARQLARRQAEASAKATAETRAATRPGPEAGGKVSFLRLVHDADRI